MRLSTTHRRAGARERDPLRGRAVRARRSPRTPAAPSIRRSATPWRRAASTASIGPAGRAALARSAAERVSYRDVDVDPDATHDHAAPSADAGSGRRRKGLAVDAAARELQPFGDFAIDAGGDLYLGGRNPDGGPWSVGIRHPRHDGQLIDSLRVSDKAVCTSGDYERGRTHILDPRTGAAAVRVASVTVVAPTAMLADALATAAFVLGPGEASRCSTGTAWTD